MASQQKVVNFGKKLSLVAKKTLDLFSVLLCQFVFTLLAFLARYFLNASFALPVFSAVAFKKPGAPLPIIFFLSFCLFFCLKIFLFQLLSPFHWIPHRTYSSFLSKDSSTDRDDADAERFNTDFEEHWTV